MEMVPDVASKAKMETRSETHGPTMVTVLVSEKRRGDAQEGVSPEHATKGPPRGERTVTTEEGVDEGGTGGKSENKQNTPDGKSSVICKFKPKKYSPIRQLTQYLAK